MNKDPDLNRRQPIRDADFIRPTSNVKEPLWEPNTDPTTSKHFRGEKHQGHAARSRHDHSQNNYKPASRELAGNLFPQSGLDEDEPACWNGIECLSPPVKDYFECPESEPEMLLLPETRPISHEQLLIEVEGIYAGLVMVDVKCIDIDERDSAAAQEKDS